MLIQGSEVSVIDGHVDMLTTPACRKCLVLVRMVLHVAGSYTREARRTAAAAAATRRRRRANLPFLVRSTVSNDSFVYRPSFDRNPWRGIGEPQARQEN